MKKLTSKYLDQRARQSVTAGPKGILKLNFDHVLYTGLPNAGRIVQTAAAKHTTPIHWYDNVGRGLYLMGHIANLDST